MQEWKGAQGLAEDVRYYGTVDARRGREADRPPLPEGRDNGGDGEGAAGPEAATSGEKLTVIAWLWARTVKSPNPAFSHVDVPLVTTFTLGSKEERSLTSSDKTLWHEVCAMGR